MNSAFRVSLASFAITLGAVVACSGSPSTAANSPPPASPNAKASASPTLDPAAPTPGGFPADLPVYPGARLTAAATFTGGGKTIWGLEWETLDRADTVQAFYGSKLQQGGWTVSFSGTVNGALSTSFHSAANPSFAGVLGIDGSSGATKITMSYAGSG